MDSHRAWARNAPLTVITAGIAVLAAQTLIRLTVKLSTVYAQAH